MRRWLELLLFAAPPLLALAVGPMLARGLGPTGRGEFAIALAVFSLAATLGSFGQAERLAADLRDGTAHRLWPRYFIVGTASTVCGFVAFVAMYLMGAGSFIAVAVAVAAPVSSFGFLWRAEAVARGRSLLLALQAAAPAVLRFAAIAVVFFFGDLTTFVATAVTMLATALGVIFLWSAIRRHKRDAPAARPVACRDRRSFAGEVKKGAVQGLPVIGFALCTAVALRADLFMLSALSTPEQVGYYAATVAVTESALAVSAAFKNRMQAAAYTDRPLSNVRHELTVMLGIALPVGVLGEAIAHPFTLVMFGDLFEPAVPALRVLIVAAVALMLVDSGQGLLAVLGQRTAMFKTSAMGAVLTAASLALLVPRFGAVGAALASVIAYSVVAAGSWMIAVRSLRDSRAT